MYLSRSSPKTKIKMSSSNLLTLSVLFIFTQHIFPFIAQASVPASNTFRYVNEGEFGPYVVEYDANYRVLDVFNNPFQLCFYNTTPNAFTLALRMGTTRTESLMRWVWEANRGKPVSENATFSLGTDGNLVLADADGRLAWQSATANKGVVGFKLLSDGNMVLHDSKGKFIWQSFDHPTDTLLVGQSLRPGSTASRLVSRASEKSNTDGAYSLVLEPKTLSLYYKSKTSPKPMPYFSAPDWFFVPKGSIEYVKLDVEPDSYGPAHYIELRYQVSNRSHDGNRILAKPKYNATLTLLRLEIDGNIKLYTYFDKVDVGAWDVTFILFRRESDNSECQLPERCGNFGLCEDSQCVACPKPNGLVGWSQDCEAPKVSSCQVNGFKYYKLVGVDHFVSKYTKGDGPMNENGCSSKCTRDCKCLGYFYHQDTSRCWIAYDLKTLTKVANSTHLGYIKAPRKY